MWLCQPESGAVSAEISALITITNQKFAQAPDHVYFLVAGLPMRAKGWMENGRFADSRC